jgi:hypothetical protein
MVLTSMLEGNGRAFRPDNDDGYGVILSEPIVVDR